jgi:hypothetical protein
VHEHQGDQEGRQENLHDGGELKPKSKNQHGPRG